MQVIFNPDISLMLENTEPITTADKAIEMLNSIKKIASGQLGDKDKIYSSIGELQKIVDSSLTTAETDQISSADKAFKALNSMKGVVGNHLDIITKFTCEVGVLNAIVFPSVDDDAKEDEKDGVEEGEKNTVLDTSEEDVHAIANVFSRDHEEGGIEVMQENSETEVSLMLEAQKHLHSLKGLKGAVADSVASGVANSMAMLRFIDGVHTLRCVMLDSSEVETELDMDKATNYLELLRVKELANSKVIDDFIKHTGNLQEVMLDSSEVETELDMDKATTKRWARRWSLYSNPTWR